MILLPPNSTRTDTLFPSPALFRSASSCPAQGRASSAWRRGATSKRSRTSPSTQTATEQPSVAVSNASSFTRRERGMGDGEKRNPFAAGRGYAPAARKGRCREHGLDPCGTVVVGGVTPTYAASQNASTPATSQLLG